MNSIPLALTGSLSWGISDFIGGHASKRRSTLAVLALSRPVGLAVVGLVSVLTASTHFDGRTLLGMLSGPAAFAALYALYRALAIGPMGVVSPIAAVGAVVPVLWGTVIGQSLAGLTYLGLGGTLVGVMLASASEGLDGQRPGRQVLVWSFFCMVMFGICMILLAEAGRYHPVEAVVVSRATEVVLILILGALSWNNLRENLRPPFGVVPFAGVLDTSAMLLFAYAAGHGSLGVAAVLSSLYPVVTVLIARLVLHERLSTVQQTGAVLTLVCVAVVVFSAAR
ncbi:integral membrane protein [Mycobacteroides abscessus subsp. bolletii]|uniref:DMT family transporter n=1 Tax=Mycobacteroides abscessus TaxID=36809 RepID=UPI000928C5FF|nr:DMT family transporter [Mycobacteroides abscessus]MDO3333042.1 DMT family transporter [Mycobacteroides abscessus subsp. bolletii]QSM89548.1 DMT family transporter [Mycobacteroides abscessus subsp. bolletii]SHQ34823.1 integral membrane protein [Mycobacteroides abscessus subsp. bolletii]SHS09632.1 integral membrane protein [Mycobacteroides abscessus subsp. bolletii]SHS81488.1 integral membrane protein [Mycobacteroides abscessus subsp. bolletii]